MMEASRGLGSKWRFYPMQTAIETGPTVSMLVSKLEVGLGRSNYLEQRVPIPES